jgi:hypothetical protein
LRAVRAQFKSSSNYNSSSDSGVKLKCVQAQIDLDQEEELAQLILMEFKRTDSGNYRLLKKLRHVIAICRGCIL